MINVNNYGCSRNGTCKCVYEELYSTAYSSFRIRLKFEDTLVEKSAGILVLTF